MMTIREFCEQYGKTKVNVYAKLRRNKETLNGHISKTPYTKTIILDEYAINYLLTDQRTSNTAAKNVNTEINSTPDLTDKSINNDNQIYKTWNKEKSTKIMTMCFNEVKSKKDALRYIPDGFKTYDLCKCAVEYNGMSLEYVPQTYITYELCRIAVSSCYTALAFVPPKYMTEEMITGAFDNFISDEIGIYEYTDYKRQLLGYVPEQFRNEKLCLKAIIAQPSNVKYIPYECFTNDIIKQALLSNVGIKHIPAKFFYNEEVIAAAVKRPVGRERIPLEYWTKPKIIDTIKKYGFDGIPRKLFDYDFYIMLIQNHYIRPEQILNSDYYLDGLTTDEINSIKKISFDRKERYDKYYDLIEQDPNNIKLFSFEDEEYDVYALIAVSRCGIALKNVPLNKITYDLCEAAVINDVDALLYVPDCFKDKIIEILTQRNDILKYIFKGGYFSDMFINSQEEKSNEVC